MNDFEIELIDEEQSENNDVQLPMNFITVGTVENDDVKVYIKQGTYSALEKYSSEDTSHEVGTILIGDYSNALGKMNVIISDYIEAKYTDASASTLTFTHETWDYIHKEKDARFAEKKIVGWQHTHPNYGIFLSNYDVFIQENFFNVPFQVAYVIDPVQNIRGFFQWKNGHIEKLKGFYIYDDIGNPIKIESTKAKDRDKKTESSSDKKKNNSVIVILCVIVALLTLLSLTLNSKLKDQIEKVDNLVSAVEEQEMKIGSLESKATEQNPTQEVTTVAESQISLVPYKVKSGDTLYSICKAHNIDYEENKNFILSINNIKNPDSIYAEQMIYVPVSGNQ